MSPTTYQRWLNANTLTVEEARRMFGLEDREYDDLFTEPAYDAKAEADRLAWVRAEEKGARPTRPLVQDEREARRRRFAADPTSILDDDDEHDRSDGAGNGPWTHTLAFDPSARPNATLVVHLVVDASGAIYAFKQAQDSVADAVAAFDQATRDAAKAATLAKREAALTLAQRRHGSASVCPRHGATTGGLCRRCAR